MRIVGQDIQHAARALGEFLLAKSQVIATAESCTGGELAAAITSIPGSSGWFEYGFITYANRAKSELLDVPKTLIDQHGAVSEQVAAAMAEGALRRAFADYAIAVTGIAGPDGGTEEKPVGTVCFAWVLADGSVRTGRRQFRGDRAEIRLQSVAYALARLIDFIISGAKL